MRPHHVAVFGAGRAGTIHLNNLLTTSLRFRAKVLYLVEPVAEAREKVKAEFGLEDEGVEVIDVSQVDKVLSDPRIDGVIVASTTHTHEDITIQSLRAGKSVFCEKPLSSSLEGIRRCYQEARQAGVHLHCSFNRRFDPTFADVRRRMLAGEAGPVHRLAIVSRDCPKPSYSYLRAAGNFVHDCAIHDIDMSAWIMGQYPCEFYRCHKSDKMEISHQSPSRDPFSLLVTEVEVYAQAHSHDPMIASFDDWDTACITMKFPNSVIATVDIDRFACYGYHQTIEILGEKAMLQTRLLNPSYMTVHTDEGSRDLLTNDPRTFSFPVKNKDSYILSLHNFFDVTEGVVEPSVTEDHVAKNCLVADAICESIRTKQAVKLSLN